MARRPVEVTGRVAECDVFTVDDLEALQRVADQQTAQYLINCGEGPILADATVTRAGCPSTAHALGHCFVEDQPLTPYVEFCGGGPRHLFRATPLGSIGSAGRVRGPQAVACMVAAAGERAAGCHQAA